MKPLNRENAHASLGERGRPLIPKVERPKVLHIGVGGFHRSHQAFFLQNLIDQDQTQAAWQIQGACIMPFDSHFVETLRKQDGLYSLRLVDSRGQEELHLISSITGIYFGPVQYQEVVEFIAADTTKVISFTVTEGGYYLNTLTGSFDSQHPDVQHDLNNPQAVPRTVFGYLARGLQLRKEAGSGKVVLLSCDNLQENGRVLQHALHAFLEIANPSLLEWIRTEVAFPNSMVDRITPRSTEQDVLRHSELLGLQDDVPVVSEDFVQWVMEIPPKDFEFPPLQQVGVEMVADVTAYEKMKLGILNGGHTLVGFFGEQKGYAFIHESIQDEEIAKFFTKYIQDEVIPTLKPIPGVDFKAYAEIIRSRFSNALIKDTNARILSESAGKFPKFVLPVLLENLRAGRSALWGTRIVVAWWQYLKKMVRSGRQDEIQDAMREQLLSVVNEHSEITDFIRLESVFGTLSTDISFLQTCLQLSQESNT